MRNVCTGWLSEYCDPRWRDSRHSTRWRGIVVLLSWTYTSVVAAPCSWAQHNFNMCAKSVINFMTLNFRKLSVSYFMTLIFFKLSVSNFVTLSFRKLSVSYFMTLNFRKMSVSYFMTLNFLKLSVSNFMTLNFRKMSVSYLMTLKFLNRRTLISELQGRTY